MLNILGDCASASDRLSPSRSWSSPNGAATGRLPNGPLGSSPWLCEQLLHTITDSAERHSLFLQGWRPQRVELLENSLEHIQRSTLGSGASFLAANFANPGLDIGDPRSFPQYLVQQRLASVSRRT